MGTVLIGSFFDDNMAVWYNLMDYVFYYNLLKVCSINGQSF